MLLAHPALVHVPLALAVIFPPVFFICWWAIAKKRLPDGTWFLLWAIAFAQSVAAAVAYYSGVQAKGFHPGAADLLAKHEELGFRFLMLWLIVTALFAFVRFGPRWAWWTAQGAITALVLAQIHTAFLLGSVGGALSGH